MKRTRSTCTHQGGNNLVPIEPKKRASSSLSDSQESIGIQDTSEECNGQLSSFHHLPVGREVPNEAADNKSNNPNRCQTEQKEIAIAAAAAVQGGGGGDFRTGLVFETGVGHYDRKNRFHKERPQRITAIRDALKAADDGAYNRCQIMGLGENNDEPPSAAVPTASTTKFVDDSDFLRVHLPGYMRR
jgi:hypothetical protein